MRYWLGPIDNDGGCMGLLMAIDGEAYDNLAGVDRKMVLRLLRVVEVVQGINALVMVVMDLICVVGGVSK